MRLEIKYRGKNKKKKQKKTENTNACGLNNQWITKEIKEVKKYLETNENENTMIKNLWGTVKALL